MNESYEEIVADVLELPLHRAVGIELIDTNDPARGIYADSGQRNANLMGSLHGGVVPLLLDVAGYLAAAELFEPGADAVTASNSVSLLRPVAIGKRITVSAEVDRFGRHAFFLSARAECDGQLVATGQIVMAVIAEAATETSAAEAQAEAESLSA
jgi:uncharacterized protein (TIGR00369 family)